MKNYKSKKQALRSEIPENYKWKTGHIFKDDRSWEENFRQTKGLIPKIRKFKSTLGESAENLYNCLKIRDRIDIQLGKLSIYANLKSDEDTRTTKYQEYREKISQLERMVGRLTMEKDVLKKALRSAQQQQHSNASSSQITSPLSVVSKGGAKK